jgi:hypothetical protein
VTAGSGAIPADSRLAVRQLLPEEQLCKIDPIRIEIMSVTRIFIDLPFTNFLKIRLKIGFFHPGKFIYSVF